MVIDKLSLVLTFTECPSTAAAAKLIEGCFRGNFIRLLQLLLGFNFLIGGQGQDDQWNAL